MRSLNANKKNPFQNSYSWLLNRKVIFAFFLSDISCLFFAGYITNLVYRESLVKENEIWLLTLFWTGLSYIFGRYSLKNKNSSNMEKIYLFPKQLQWIIVFYTLSWMVNNRVSPNYYFSYDSNFIYIIIFFVTNSILFKLIRFKVFKNLKNNYKWGFYGSSEDYKALNCLLNQKNNDYQYTIDNVKLGDNITDNYEGIIFSKEFLDKENEKYLMLNIINKNIAIYFLDDWLEIRLNRIPFEYINIENLLKNFNRIKSNKLQVRLKRFGDVVISVFLLFLTLPLLIISAFLIWLSDRGPIFYVQRRVGKDGKEFNIYKLRTMIINAEKGKAEWVKVKDKRITVIGKILRKTRLDEIPQLVCVLNGDMSLIGPRPERPEIEVDLKSQIFNYELRHMVKPGLSGWAQVNSNYAASLEGVKRKLSYDLYYISNQSIWIDLLILIKTIKVVFNFQGSEPIE